MSADDLGRFVVQQSTKLGLSRTDLARRAGVSRQTLNKIINGEIADPTIGTVVGLARALQVATLYLLRLFYGPYDMRIHTESEPKHPGDYSSFVEDVTVPDGSIVFVGQRFEKIWKIQNTGGVDWIDRSLVCIDDPDSATGLIPEARRIALPPIAAGEVVDIRMVFQAPPYPCVAASNWKMVDAAGELCFPEMQALICVVQAVTAL